MNNNNGRKVRRRVNPVLLLGGKVVDENNDGDETQPSLVKVTDFEKNINGGRKFTPPLPGNVSLNGKLQDDDDSVSGDVVDVNHGKLEDKNNMENSHSDSHTDSHTDSHPDSHTDSHPDSPVGRGVSSGKVNPLFLAGERRSGLFQTLPPGVAKPRGQYSRKVDSNVEFESWDENSGEVEFGLGGELDTTYVEPQYSKAFHLTERDMIVMRFLARYRYAYTDMLARLVDTMPKTVIARLRVLEKRGFVRKEAITERQYLWTTRKAGNLIVDISFPEIRKGSISYATIAHTIGLGNLGVEFEREVGGKDLLGEGKGVAGWVMPANRWKLGLWGSEAGKTLGEMTVTEREIRQGQLRWRGGRSSKEMRELVSLAAGAGEGVELEEGQEGLFVIYGAGGKGGEHIPDLVVARERDEKGKPQHIAIELELTPKTLPDWRKILRNYRDNGEMYSKVYYFTHKRSISTALQKVGEEVGLGDQLVIRRYAPQNNRLPFWG